MSKKFEPYEYLNDNGFFNNDYQYETVIIPVENKNEISFCEKAGLIQKRDENIIDKIIYEMWKYSDFEIGFKAIGLSLLFAPLYIIAFNKGDFNVGIFGIISQLLIISFGILEIAGKKIARSLLAKSKGLRAGQTLYAINFNYDIFPVKLYDIEWNDKKEMMYTCTTLIGIEDNSFQKYIAFNEDELFLTPEQALQFVSLIHSRRIEALTPLLNDKTEAFLNGPLYQKYSALYYKKRNVYVDRDSYSSKINHLSIYDFLMSKQSLISFCNFIKKTKAEEEAAIHKQEAQDKEDNSLIGDILDSVQKDMMDSI